VAITGIGTVSAAGAGHEALWAGLVEDHDRPSGDAVADLDDSAWLGRAEARRLDPYLRFAIVAAGLALDDAGSPAFVADRAGVVMANLYGAATSLEAQRDVLAERGPKAVSPLLAAHACEDACASQLSIRFGLTGPSRLCGASCAGGTLAVSEGAALIADGRCDLVLAGGTLGPLTDVLRTSYTNLRVVSPSDRARPLDRRRDGFVFADGASVWGWARGWAQTNDAFHVSKPSGEGIERCMRLALAHAGLEAAAVAHVNAHAAGTGAGDHHEAAAITRVFAPSRPSVTSIKGRTGHSLAAAGAFEVASVLLSFRYGLLPSTAMDLEADPDFDVDVVHGPARPWSPAPVLSNSFGLGGHNASIVLAPTPS
jgi:3-oxoacyl-[acyl-carrier-protein] synthase II